MDTKLKRKEIWLHPKVMEMLQTLADKKQWSLKQYMEWVLIKDANKVKVNNKSI